jgi:hypothetical protein
VILLVRLLHSSPVESNFWAFRDLGDILALDKGPRLALIEGAAHPLDASLLDCFRLDDHDGPFVLAVLLLRLDEFVSDSA